ncbi:hypothetical protein BDV19DRAFT_68083 [Aspergillus venezuelensis]
MRLTTPLLLSLSAVAVSAHEIACFRFKEKVLTENVNEGIRYLRSGKVQDMAHLDPDMCWRVSCSYNTAISWCNRDKKKYKSMAFVHIAEGAQALVNECGQNDGRYTGGVVDHPDKWQVIVHQDKC